MRDDFIARLEKRGRMFLKFEGYEDEGQLMVDAAEILSKALMLAVKWRLRPNVNGQTVALAYDDCAADIFALFPPVKLSECKKCGQPSFSPDFHDDCGLYK